MQDASVVTTKKLYYEDAYAREFEARVLSFDGQDLVLDQTLFFPEEGGQSPDRGEIDGIRVADVQIRGGEIHHVLDVKDLNAKEIQSEVLFRPGQTIHGRIDWHHRFSNMQQHSGEHLFSGVVHARYGFENIGFHLGNDGVTVDFDGAIPKADLPGIELQVNRAIWENIPSEVRMTRPEERTDLVYRSKLDLPGEVRIVSFPGVDSCACCAPHVARTGEIGLVKIMGMIRWKKGVRVSILCGERALEALAREHAIVQKTANYLTTSVSEILPQTERMQEEIRNLQTEIRDKNRTILESEAARLPQDQENVTLCADDIDMKSARDIVTDLTGTHSGYCTVLFTVKGRESDPKAKREGRAPQHSEDIKYQYVIGSRTKDCRVLQGVLKERFDARGGGKAAMIQGSLAGEKNEILRLLNNS